MCVLKIRPYYLGSVFGTLIFGNSIIWLGDAALPRGSKYPNMIVLGCMRLQQPLQV